jgi:myo-inositol 2-dehydrogenase/D-chiro-inositol 1-dehydrogenase
MEHPPIRIGIVGCGGLTQAVHIPCLVAEESFRVVAVCDLREEAAKRAAARLPGSRAYTDSTRLLDEALDAVLICAPPAVHEAMTLAALERGLHVFLEKPPSMTAAGARRLVEAAAGKAQRAMVGLMWRHAPAHRMAKELSQRPEFGQVLTFYGRYVCPGPGMRMDWGLDRSDDAQMVRFFMLDHIVHLADATRFFMGDVARIQAVRSRTESESYALAVNLTFASGLVGSWTLAFRAAAFDGMITLVGDGPATVQVRNWQQLEYVSPQPPIGPGGYSGHPAFHWDGGIGFADGIMRPGYREEWRAFGLSIREGAECRAGVEDAWQAMRIVEALTESLRTGGAVEISAV